MDRRFTYVGAIPQDIDASIPQVNAMKALGFDIQAWMGTTTRVDGLAIAPTVPASLSISIGPGSILTLEPVDQNSFGSLGSDQTHQIIKQGILSDAALLTLTPPTTPGQAINYLIQAEILEQDVNSAVLPYFNPASLTDPNAIAWSGPNNSGVQQPLTRQCTVSLSAKAGTAATAGTQVTPSPDAGYTPLYIVTVAQGATTLTATNWIQSPLAPFIWLKLPDVPLWVQGGSYAFCADTGTANAIVGTLTPIPTQYTTGMRVAVKKMSSANTGAMTVSFNGLAAVALLDQTGAALTNGALPGGDLIEMVYDGTSFRALNSNVTYTTVNSLTAVSGEGILVESSGKVDLNYPALSSDTPLSPDLFSFYSQDDSHHRVVTWAAMQAGLSSTGIKNMQVFTSSGTYTKSTNVTKALVFATGAGGAGGVHVCCAGGGGAGQTAVALVDVSSISTVAVTIGAAGLGVVAPSAGASSGGDGGQTSFGSYVVALGGYGCKGSDKGGEGGGKSGGTGTMRIAGGDGMTSYSGTEYGSGNGGPSFWGGGGCGTAVDTANINGAGSGEDGSAYGAGGGGGDSGMSSSARGGNGAGGVVLVLEF